MGNGGYPLTGAQGVEPDVRIKMFMSHRAVFILFALLLVMMFLVLVFVLMMIAHGLFARLFTVFIAVMAISWPSHKPPSLSFSFLTPNPFTSARGMTSAFFGRTSRGRSIPGERISPTQKITRARASILASDGLSENVCGEAAPRINSPGAPTPFITPATSEWSGLMETTTRGAAEAETRGLRAEDDREGHADESVSHRCFLSEWGLNERNLCYTITLQFCSSRSFYGRHEKKTISRSWSRPCGLHRGGLEAGGSALPGSEA